MDKVIGGISAQREPFSVLALEIFRDYIDMRRSLIELSGDVKKGNRFKDNVAVLARLESMFTEDEFMECPGLRIDDALCDAANTDYWYEYEKQYDDMEDEANDYDYD